MFVIDQENVLWVVVYWSSIAQFIGIYWAHEFSDVHYVEMDLNVLVPSIVTSISFSHIHSSNVISCQSNAVHDGIAICLSLTESIQLKTKCFVDHRNYLVQ